VLREKLMHRHEMILQEKRDCKIDLRVTLPCIAHADFASVDHGVVASVVFVSLMRVLEIKPTTVSHATFLMWQFRLVSPHGALEMIVCRRVCVNVASVT
jgi:hypothetical protein